MRVYGGRGECGRGEGGRGEGVQVQDGYLGVQVEVEFVQVVNPPAELLPATKYSD